MTKYRIAGVVLLAKLQSYHYLRQNTPGDDES